MPFTAKATIYLSYKNAGASFNLWKSVEGLTDMKAPVDRLCKKLGQLLGRGVDIPYIRVSDESVRGDSLFLNLRYHIISEAGGDPVPEGLSIIKTAQVDDPDFHSTAVQILLQANSVRKGRLALRFVPDSLCDYPAGLSQNGAWETALDKFKEQLVADKWMIRGVKDSGQVPAVAISTQIGAAGNNYVVVTTKAPHGASVGEKVRLSKIVPQFEPGGDKALNGVFTVRDVINATSYSLAKTANQPLVKGEEGTSRRLVTDYAEIKEVFATGLVRRKAGRPFGAPVGRR